MRKKIFILITIVIILISCDRYNNVPFCVFQIDLRKGFYEIGDTLIISVDSWDIDGYVECVRFYDDSTLLFIDNDTPYVYTWYTNSINQGSHTITVESIDNKGGCGWTSTWMYFE